MKHKLQLIFLLVLFWIGATFPQNFSINKIEPPNWWAGMKWNKVQLMVYGKNLDSITVSSVYPRLKITGVYQAESSSYLFVDIEIPGDLPEGNYDLVFNKNGEIVKYSYPVYQREFLPEEHKGFSNEDVIYLIFADRFCDGNPDNNTIDDSLDNFSSQDLNGRKGGDIEGIISKLDYLDSLGVSALWITPMLENNMWMSYHGYAATNLYRIDPRFGSNELCKHLVAEAHQKGLKIILDHVSNHIGINHEWMKDLPFADWINGTVENHLPAHHDKMAFLDIHGDSIMVKFNQEGWFEDYMPDLNQRNPFLKKYLIQNTLWWIEFAGIDGIREDTYPYCDQKYLSEWAEAILNEYPNFNIVGEVWKGVPSIISGYQHNSPVRMVGFDSNLPAVTDFALSDAIRTFLNGTKGLYPVYETLVQDIVYDNPDNLIVFMDNHDITRAMYEAKGDQNKFKIALNLVLFTRGIPVLFYGTEIGIKGTQHHGEIRQPFPGGFAGDERNAFTKEGRTGWENGIYNYVHKLLEVRKKYPALAKGKLTQVYPGNGIYFLFKSFEDEKFVLIINGTGNEVSLPSEEISLFERNEMKLINVLSNEAVEIKPGNNLTLKKTSANIYRLEK